VERIVLGREDNRKPKLYDVILKQIILLGTLLKH